MKIVVATRNRGKLAEYRRMFQQLDIEVQSLEEAGVDKSIELPENGETFEANARSKTLALQRHLGGWAMGDDSGLEVDALGGAPGVYSARYAGIEGTGPERDRANLARLLSELTAVPDRGRNARFVCAITLLGPESNEITSRGTCKGRIIHSPRGTSGFGYDPVFVPDGFERTMAELDMDEKNRISHRGRALAALIGKVRESGIK